MDILTLLANIAQIISLIWLIIFGSKTLNDLRKGRPKGIKLTSQKLFTSVMVMVNLLLVIIVLFLAPLLLSNSRSSSPSPTTLSQQVTPTPTITTSPTTRTGSSASGQVYIFLATPKLPITIPCSINCVSKFDVSLKQVVYERTRNDILMTFGLTNRGSGICSMAVDELRLYDSYGSYNGQGQILNVPPLDTGQVLIATATFSFAPSPGSPYFLSFVLSCQANMPMIFKTENLIFDSYVVQHNPPPNPVSALVNSVVGYIRTPLGISIFLFVFICLLVLIFIWLAQTKPFGVLEQGGRVIDLEGQRTLARRVFRKSTISSRELLEYYGFDPKGGQFDLVFKGKGVVFIRARSESPQISLTKRGGRTSTVLSDKRGDELHFGDVIKVKGDTIAIFDERRDERDD